MKTIIPMEELEGRILILRGQKVMLDMDLAELYGVTTKRLNQQVNRNRRRFPPDFMFTLNATEKSKVVANCNHLQKLKYSSALPQAFTEHGAVMLASVLNTPVAVDASIQVVRAFSKLRSLLAAHKDLAKQLEQLEGRYDAQFKVVFDAIRELMSPPETSNRKRIGFRDSGS